MSLTIRPRDSADIPTLISILTDIYNLTKYPVDGPPSFPARFSASNALTSIVALHDGTLAGHAELQDTTGLNPVAVKSLISNGPLDSFAALVSLFVDPKMQGKGIGARLVEETLAWGRAHGKRLVLVVLDKDPAAIRLYEGMKWERQVEYTYENVQGVKFKAYLYLAPV
jgi:GNAT superfamily N-acetyltransferase